MPAPTLREQPSEPDPEMLATVSPIAPQPVKRGGSARARRTDRGARAQTLYADRRRWMRSHRKPDGRPYLTVPGTTKPHAVDLLYCTCEYAQYMKSGDACSHILAVRLWWADYRAGLVEQPSFPDDDDWAFFERQWLALGRRAAQRDHARNEADVEPDWNAYDRAITTAELGDLAPYGRQEDR
jgi:hypothetical protein